MAVAIRPLATNWRLELLEDLCCRLWDHGVYALLADHHELPSDDVPADAISTDRVSASEAAVSHLLNWGIAASVFWHPPTRPLAALPAIAVLWTNTG